MTGSSPIRILTVDDHPLVRDGITRVRPYYFTF